MFSLISKKENDNRNKIYYKYILKDNKNKSNLIVLTNDNFDYFTIYDDKFEPELSKFHWHKNSLNYIVNKEKKYMHILIMELANLKTNDPKLSIDHINWIKTDNRLCNLRMATQSEQNSNRASRSDKLPPFKELNITEYPRHIRWDASEEKFVIEKHPILIKEVEKGLRKKPFQSGTKAKSLSIVEKYQDILAKLKILDDQKDNSFDKIREERLNEYNQIIKTIKEFESIDSVSETDSDQASTSTNIKPELRTIKGRKKNINLPEDCGITIDMIPKNCWYQKKSSKRGDAFIIESHPKLDGKTWSTSTSKKINTKDKFDMLLDKLNSLDIN